MKMMAVQKIDVANYEGIRGVLVPRLDFARQMPQPGWAQ